MVRPKDGILDPQGDAADAAAQVERMCSELLANPLIESYEIVLEDA